MIIIFRIQIIIFIILIIISNLSGQSFYSNNFFLKNLLTTIIIIIIIIIVIIFFLYFSSLQSLSIQPCGSLNPRGVRTNLDGRVCTQCASLLARHLGLQTLLHGSAHPRLAGLGLQTQARSRAAARRAGLPPAPKVGQTPHQVFAAQGRGQAHVVVPNTLAWQPQRQVSTA